MLAPGRASGGLPACASDLHSVPTPAFSQLFYEHTDSLRNPPTRLPKNIRFSAHANAEAPAVAWTPDVGMNRSSGPRTESGSHFQLLSTPGEVRGTEPRAGPKSRLKTHPAATSGNVPS